MKKCPYCAEEIQDDAIKCRYCREPVCESHTLQSSADTGNTVGGNSALRVLGLLVLLGGLGAMVYYWQFFDASVAIPAQELFGETIGGGRVHHIGLMQDRQNGMIVSGIFGAIGFVCVLIGEYSNQRQ